VNLEVKFVLKLLRAILLMMILRRVITESVNIEKLFVRSSSSPKIVACSWGLVKAE
jgi:hypothetical protein